MNGNSKLVIPSHVRHFDVSAIEIKYHDLYIYSMNIKRREKNSFRWKLYYCKKKNSTRPVSKIAERDVFSTRITRMTQTSVISSNTSINELNNNNYYYDDNAFYFFLIYFRSFPLFFPFA